MKFLKMWMFVMIALLWASGDADAMASNHHRHRGGGGGGAQSNSQSGGGAAQDDPKSGPDSPGQRIAVSEPGTLILTGLGLGAIAVWRKARRRLGQKQDGRSRRSVAGR